METRIELKQIGKRYRKDWIFRNVDFEFQSNKSYVIQGPNGSGKSTFLKLCASYLLPTKGSIEFNIDGKEVLENEISSHITIAAPYMELPEEFTPLEILDFHLGFKSFYDNISKADFLQLIDLHHAKDKPLNKFSSGMKQRMKLGLAIASQSEMLFLDEPTINLDAKGIALYKELIQRYHKDRIIMVCSNNIKDEFDFCEVAINVADYKK